MMIICTRCKELRPELDFREFKKSNKTYKSRICRNCDNLYAREYRRKNPEKTKLSIHSWNDSHKEHKRLYQMKYRNSHPEYVQRQKDYTKEWSKLESTKLKKIVWENNRRAKKNIGGVVTEDEWISLLDFYGHRCLRCGRTNVKLTQDHVIPLKLGGKHSIDNLQPLCKLCNSIKQARFIDYRISDYREVDDLIFNGG